MSLKLAIVGRPNVGKSTLFNRLVGKRLALVDDQPGVTRDLREGAARLGDLRFTVIDTAGLEQAHDDTSHEVYGNNVLRASRALAASNAAIGSISIAATRSPLARASRTRALIGPCPLFHTPHAARVRKADIK